VCAPAIGNNAISKARGAFYLIYPYIWSGAAGAGAQLFLQPPLCCGDGGPLSDPDGGHAATAAATAAATPTEIITSSHHHHHLFSLQLSSNRPVCFEHAAV